MRRGLYSSVFSRNELKNNCNWRQQGKLTCNEVDKSINCLIGNTFVGTNSAKSNRDPPHFLIMLWIHAKFNKNSFENRRSFFHAWLENKIPLSKRSFFPCP